VSLRALAGHLTRILLALMLLGIAPVWAAPPPLKIAKARQASIREGLKTAAPVTISLTILGEGVQSFSASDVRLGVASKLELAATAARAKPSTQVIDAKAPMPWSVVFSLLTAPEPLAALEATLGAIDPAHSAIDIIGEQFVYEYGVSPRVGLSRDFGQIRRVVARVDGVVWEFRLSGELGVSGLWERVDILRDGGPFGALRIGKVVGSR